MVLTGAVKKCWGEKKEVGRWGENHVFYVV
jgi:hypothetical protein